MREDSHHRKCHPCKVAEGVTHKHSRWVPGGGGGGGKGEGGRQGRCQYVIGDIHVYGTQVHVYTDKLGIHSGDILFHAETKFLRTTDTLFVLFISTILHHSFPFLPHTCMYILADGSVEVHVHSTLA